MNTPVRLLVFALGLVAVFAAAVGIGRATGPVGPVGPADGREMAHAGDGGGHGDGHETDAAEPGLPGGLATSQDGYTLVLDRATLRPGTREVAFRITDEHGDAVTDYRVEHEKRLHLVAVRRDGTGFQHVHPDLGPDGTWRVQLDLTPSAWRVFADVAPDDADPLVLGADLLVPGSAAVSPAPPLTRTASVDDHEVTVEGDLVAGEHSPLTLTVTQDGVPVTDLEPYLGAYGHLVALREGDLAYLHVHPEEGAGVDGQGGPAVAFVAEVPSAGRYRLYLDFQHDGVVHTASFLLEASHDDH